MNVEDINSELETIGFGRLDELINDNHINDINNNISEDSDTTKEVQLPNIETPQIEVPINSWIRSLRDIGNQSLKLEDYGYTYIFKRVIDPCNNLTNKFEVFCNPENTELWFILNGLLTDKYVVVSLSDLVSYVCSQFNISESRISKEPWRAIWIGRTNINVNYFDDETSKMIFSLISGLDDAIISNLYSNISLSISNSYNGSRTLRIDYNINSSCNLVSNSDLRNVKLTDFFSLNRFSHKVIHNSNITQINTDLKNINDNIDITMETLKNYRDNIDDIIKTISRGFKKENKNQFISVCQNLVPEYRNLYIILICVSAILSNNYSIGEHINIRFLVDTIFCKVFGIL